MKTKKHTKQSGGNVVSFEPKPIRRVDLIKKTNSINPTNIVVGNNSENIAENITENITENIAESYKPLEAPAEEVLKKRFNKNTVKFTKMPGSRHIFQKIQAPSLQQIEEKSSLSNFGKKLEEPISLSTKSAKQIKHFKGSRNLLTNNTKENKYSRLSRSLSGSRNLFKKYSFLKPTLTPLNYYKKEYNTTHKMKRKRSKK
jgi:hypothetical protein